MCVRDRRPVGQRGPAPARPAMRRSSRRTCPCSGSRSRARGSASSPGCTPLRLEARRERVGERRRSRIALNDHVRPSRYMNDAVEAGTSATGAKSTLIPRPCRAAPVATPCVRATAAQPERAHLRRRERRRRPRDPLDRPALLVDRDQERRLAAGRGRRLELRASASCRAAAVVMLAPNRITPPTSPRRIRPSRSALGVVPSIADDELLADQLGDRRHRGRPARGATRAPAPRRRCRRSADRRAADREAQERTRSSMAAHGMHARSSAGDPAPLHGGIGRVGRARRAPRRAAGRRRTRTRR